MRAIDTNIIVRLIALDDEAQVAIAAKIVAEPFLLVPTVILEAVWVLQSTYGMKRAAIAEGLWLFLRSDKAAVISASAVFAAVEAFRSKGQFADHLHVALAEEAGANSFATFDGKLKTAAAPAMRLEAIS